MTNRRWGNAVAKTCGLLVAATALAWTVTVSVPVVVPTASALTDVGFGWPLPWYHQDLSRFEYAYFPIDVTVIGDRVDPVPTTVDWMAFSGSIAITALVLWPVAAVLIRGLARVAMSTRQDAQTRET